MGAHSFDEGGALPTATPATNGTRVPEHVLTPDDYRALVTPPARLPARRVSWVMAWAPLLVGMMIGAALAAVLIKVIFG